jgi:hypothetical protein
MRIRLVEHVAVMEEKRNAYRVLVGKHGGKNLPFLKICTCVILCNTNVSDIH